MSNRKFAAVILTVLLCACALGALRYAAEDSAGPARVAPTAPPEESAPPAEPSAAPEPSASPSPEPAPTPSPEPDYPDIDPASWEYALANAQNSIGEYEPELTEMENGQYFDSRAAGALQSFMDAARAEGLSVYLSSTYRGYSEQKYLYERKVSQYGGDEAAAAAIVAPPGTSEHQLGLAADITDRYYETKTVSLEDTELFKWMSAHCAEYGFIVRYPADKEDVTGIMYEPWHFRYVGTEAAEYIMENGLCLEEFLALYATAG